VRPINAIPGSPPIGFLIEERLLTNVPYKSSGNTVRYDDLDYFFNFEVQFPEQADRTRVAREPLKVVADQEYSFVISGLLSAPTITIWEKELRSWLPSETVFSVQFGHTAESLSDIDIYFAPPGIDPVIGEERGTLSFTQVLPAIELESGEYVITIASAAGAETVFNPATIIYQSDTITVPQITSLLYSIFDGDANDTSPWAVRTIDVSGISVTTPTANDAPTTQFVQASTALAAADIYDNETLTDPIVTNHNYTDVTEDIVMEAGLATVTYTAVDNVGAILFEDTAGVVSGGHTRFVVVGGDIESLSAVNFVLDRSSVDTFGKFSILNASANFPVVDTYIIEGDPGITDILPRLLGLTLGSGQTTVTLDSASYSMYITPFAEKTILAGPIPLDVALGDVIDVTILDVVGDPTIVEALFIPVP
jgi:hypothetical protein